jgi:hypothetical protein
VQPGTSNCADAPTPSGTACNDNNPCTVSDACDGTGTCKGTTMLCAPSDSCHGAGSCDPSTGLCSNPALADGSTCSSGTKCTVGETCTGGVCGGGVPMNCAGDPCHPSPFCDAVSGACNLGPALGDGTACDDGDACTAGTACHAGVCGMPTSTVKCPGGDQCHAGGMCDPKTGTCTTAPKPPGAVCDDGNLCTTGDVCRSDGTCGGNPIVCNTPLDPQCADTQGTCSAGTCQYTLHVGAACDDGDPTTANDACGADGICHGGGASQGAVAPPVGETVKTGCAYGGDAPAMPWLLMLAAAVISRVRRRRRRLSAGTAPRNR